MARQGDNQIQPVARPVQAFIEPVRVSVAEPARPAQLPGARQPSTVQQGGTPSVQGFNSFEALAQDLESFNRQLTPVLQTIGLQYADGQMRQGEARGRAEALRALAQNDAAMENAELDRAKANRALATKDPQAAGIMALLNPYGQVGYERGMAKVAGGEVAIGLPDAIQQRAGEIDYLAPDQGQGQVRRIADEYSSKLMQRYGLTAESPAFQRFVAPEVEKAREKVGLQMAKDRQDYLDAQSVESTAAQMRNTYIAAKASKAIDYNGTRYVLTDDPQQATLFNAALHQVLQGQLNRATQTGALPGDGRKRQKEIFKLLDKQGWYANNGFREMVGSLESTDAVVDENGKPIIDPATGKPARLVLASIYMDEDLEAKIKMGAANRAERTAMREDMLEGKDGFETYIWKRIGSMLPGPEREEARDAAIAEYWNNNSAAVAQAGVSLPELLKRAKAVGDLTSSLAFQDQPEPDMPDRELAGLATRRGDKWDARAEYQRGQVIAQHFRDKQEAGKWLIRWNGRVAELDKENTSMTQYKEPRDSVINQWANQNLNTYYGPSDRKNQGDRSASRSRQWQAYAPYVTAVLQQEEGKKGSKLTDAEVRKFTTDALTKYGSGADGDKQKEYLFPGSQYTDTPGITPKTKPRNNGVGPVQGARPPSQEQPYTGKVYEVNGLDSIPDRKILLRNYEKLPVLSAPALNTLIDAAAQGKPWPKAFEKAWRDAGAPNGGQFIMQQIQKYPGAFELPPELQQKILKRASADAGAGDYMVSQQATAQRFPNLAMLTGAALDLVTGARPAMAVAFRPEAPAAPAGGGGGGASLPINGLVLLARNAGFAGENAAIMAAIAMAESGGRPGAHNPNRATGDNSYGLWQINMIDRLGPERTKQFGIRRNEDLFDPGANAMAARKVHGSQGFGAWSVYRSGAYLQYLPAARQALGGR